MILMIDNYDSFTYNLVQYFRELGQTLHVVRNDAVTVADVEKIAPDYLVISPGPCAPAQAGMSMPLIEAFAGTIPILGVCLGHQSIAQVFGGQVVRAPRLMHGKVSPVEHDGQTMYAGLSNPFTATRYHSLCVPEATLPDCLEVSARTAEGEVMGLRHRTLAVEGVQFHPESILTVEGKQLLHNFLSYYGPMHQ
ncbi:anthranilate synthase component II [Heliophilum fasciatum]|uniref:Anthranilate synthase component 2/para-aminobenzoate synthetase component 2 n=1 Tax=Heliophilum fasciatum TaxID=35700 RepID=A0A4R2RL06_9FIRM|nr:aminodeoxychorismate/anthranilate synthase component II [Heliophilum fasciatum]MCW2278313.1 anthranilate synthase/aminodeoxychorismate synthase-like glutamine amidotransferase [Heliophilum fasciatum]TCP63813.1 anthranilate synthase component 2/para-aminobenzoate synthetase component 2 [Heliophilum fasciatum]